MPHQTRPLKRAPTKQINSRLSITEPTSSNKKRQKQKLTTKPPPAKRRCTSCPDCKTASLTTLDTPFAQEGRLKDGRVRLPGYVACAASCGYLGQRVRDPRTGKCGVVEVPDRLAERWCAVELCVALGTEPEPEDYDGCYVGEVRVEFNEIDWEGSGQQQQQQSMVGEDLGYRLSAAVCEMLDDALEGRLEMGIFGDGGAGADEKELLEDMRPVTPLWFRVVDDQPVSPRTVPADFERMVLSFRDETPESSSGSEISDWDILG
ncbi:uncharacterized protein PgNI_03607 [Pyricularia grisea]|uniref:Uncharacterized protein n=1 Tax=Pyricularia grisea TaxID=148305 RepID=A0A6P8B913_PYRGI|nr:uncharacterized protein PgNI_03607 [Pyricularia grisea]TLD12330.1 hypothetical protein PgNI_03607 [Pyricularia grisea]